MRMHVVVMIVAAVLGLSAVDSRGGENLWYSVFVPGWGQINAGHYGRGALFVSGELVSLSMLAISQIQYDRAVEQYDRAKGAYLHAGYIGDAVGSYDLMNEKWDDAEKLHGYRQAAVTAAVGIWVVNVIDIILFDETEEPLLSFEARPGGFLVTGCLSF